MRRSVAIAALLCLGVSVLAFSQGGNSQLGGVVTDPSGALIPGVTITVTNVDTGIVNTAVTNESGSYNFASLLPGRNYRVSASLPGFQTKTVTALELGTATNVRQDFQLSIASSQTKVEVSIEANSLITTAGASIGEVLSINRVRDLPIVGNDVLSLINVMPGVNGESFAGVSSQMVNTVRDGLSVSDGRFSSAGVFGTTVINPDLVGEIRLILAPVDAELGRGNGQIQIQTRSGTNRFTGSAVWNVRNSGLNPNTWGNNNDLDATTGQWSPTVPNWYNQHQYTISYGGPVIRNKTFFFVLWDQQLDYRRDLINATTMTETAKKGIFRYWSGWNPTFAGATVSGNTGSSSTNRTAPAVDFQGNPVAPPNNPDLSPYTGSLTCFSVFGNVKVDGSPFTAQDCPGGTAITSAVPFDTNRAVLDTTGYIAKILDKMPTANYFGQPPALGTSDGLNQAYYRYTRSRNGVGGANATIGNDENQNRKQINIKIDHNFNQNHKVAFNWSYERNNVFSDTPNWPGGISYKTIRYPQVMTINGTSTLSPSLLNEARFGLRLMKAGIDAPWEDSYGDQEATDRARSYMLDGSNGYTALISPGAGAYSFGGSANGVMTTAPGQYNGNRSPLYDYADTLSWTHSKHAFKFGAEARYATTDGYNNIPQLPFPRITGGAGGINSPVGTAPAVQPSTSLLATARGNATNMLYFLAGSVNNSSMLYWINDASDVTNGHWEDVQTIGRKNRDLKEHEFAFFGKDDWKATKDLTLNLGLRWEYYGPSFFGSGFTTTAVDTGYGLFGTGRVNNDPLSNWLSPGNVYLSGYGPGATTATALRCTTGVAQAPLPTSSCDPNMMTTVEFVGPNTPNPDKSVLRPDRNNFGPAIGFAWQLPFFGQGKTTVRGGYQMTFGGSGRNNGGGASNSVEVILGGAPGAISQANANSAGVLLPEFVGQYLDLNDVPAMVPVRPTSPNVPGGTIEIYNRGTAFSAYDPNFVTPYTQNFTLSVTRSVSRNVTVDVRYIGTVSVKSEGFLNTNLNDVYYNKELFDALAITRAGGDAPLFDQMFAGLNLNSGTTGFGPVGSLQGGILQTGSAHLRRNATFSTNLANGDFGAVAASLNGNGSNLPASGSGAFLSSPVTAGGRLLRNGCDRMANGQTTVGPNNPAPMRCFPENYIVGNSQLGTTTYVTNTGRSNYHSVQAQFTLRPVQGFSIQSTYTLAKNLTLPGSGYTDPLNRNADYRLSGTDHRHDLRTNGTFELPIGPNKLLLGNSSGWLARLVERWQTGFIVNVMSGQFSSLSTTYANGAFTQQTGLYGNSVPDVVGPLNLDSKVTWGYSTTNPAVSNGRYFGDTRFEQVVDPQCNLVSAADTMGTNLQSLCGLNAVADATTHQVILQNPQPGTRGNLGQLLVKQPGTWSFDANASKTFRISESKSLQVRIDTTNVLNHPSPNTPTFNLNGNNALGVITGKGTQTRAFQGQVRLTF